MSKIYIYIPLGIGITIVFLYYFWIRLVLPLCFSPPYLIYLCRESRIPIIVHTMIPFLRILLARKNAE